MTELVRPHLDELATQLGRRALAERAGLSPIGTGQQAHAASNNHSTILIHQLRMIYKAHYVPMFLGVCPLTHRFSPPVIAKPASDQTGTTEVFTSSSLSFFLISSTPLAVSATAGPLNVREPAR